MQNKSLRVYACGGTGINIATKLENLVGDKNDYDNIDVVYLDTSRSNLGNTCTEDNTLIIPRINSQLHRSEGSGKNRSVNEEAIYEAIPGAFTKFPPHDLNAVVFSGSGGSGSVIGPLLVDQLLADGQNVVVVLLGTEESVKAANNTRGTLMTLEAISNAHEVPVVVNYTHMAPSDVRSQVDQDLVGALLALSVLINRTNQALDLEDIHNLLYYNKVLEDVAPGVALMEIHLGKDKVEESFKDKPMLGLAAVLRDTDSTLPNVGTMYDAIGYYAENTIDENTLDMYYAISREGLDAIFQGIVDNNKRAEKLLHGQSRSVSFLGAGKTEAKVGRTGRIVL